jgi:D-alanyl-D-alanine endopeptidase (penicillin-binding protein 7)
MIRLYCLSVLFLWALLLPSAVFANTNDEVLGLNASSTSSYSRSEKEFASALVIDAKSKKVLYEYNADKKWSVASITKLMTSLVFLEHRPSWNKIVSIKKQDEVGGGRLRVKTGATMSVLDLFYSSISASANNTAMAMARISGLSQKNFVKAMNSKAKALGLKNTTFADQSGMDPKNLSTARDLAKLATTAFNIEAIRRPASTAKYKFVVRNTGELKVLTNTNDLLFGKDFDDLYVTGGKTGFIYESMYNLVVRLKPTGAKGSDRALMIVVLGAPTRESSFTSAKGLAEWAWKGYTLGQ